MSLSTRPIPRGHKLGAAAAAVALAGLCAPAAPAGAAGGPGRPPAGAAVGDGRLPSVRASSGAPRATGYVARWKFNANDGTPLEVITVAPSGHFVFNYRPSSCSSGGFHISGAFAAVRFVNVPFLPVFQGLKGYVVTFSAGGSCWGHDNTFTWHGARGIATGFVNDGKWPDSRFVQGEMTQVATTKGARGPLTIDWGMAAEY
jgi:hypothetical protein